MEPIHYSSARATLRATALIAWLLVLLPFVLFFWLIRLQRPRAYFAQCYFGSARRILGIKINELGAPSTQRPLLIVSNHASYLDVFIIGSQLPLSFTPKREVRSWPLVGFLCVLADCVFVERKPSQMEEAREEMAERINEGRVLCLFPEGTTSDGKNIKPFKSGFLSLAEMHNLPVQPASLIYTHIGTTPITDEHRDKVAWIGENTTFFGHFLQLLKMPGIKATLVWHSVLSLNDYEGRKELTKAAQEVVVAGVLEHVQ